MGGGTLPRTFSDKKKRESEKKKKAPQRENKVTTLLEQNVRHQGGVQEQHKTTRTTHGAYGAVQAGGHLWVLVAVHRRLAAAAAAAGLGLDLGGRSGRGRFRVVPLQPVWVHLASQVTKHQSVNIVPSFW